MMIIKNLTRRKTRTLLTVIGIAIGVAAIIGLGAMADGLQVGYSSMLTGSQADLVLSQPNSIDISFSSLDDELGDELKGMPEVSAVSGMLQGWTQTEGEPFFFVFGYPEDSFVLQRFQIIEGDALISRAAHTARGKPVLLGSAAAEVLDKSPGDAVRLTGSVFRVVGVYETGDAFEDSGALLELSEAQNLLGKQRQVSVYYVQLKDPSLQDRFVSRVERRFDELSISGTSEFAEEQTMVDMLRAYVWVIGGLAILIGGVGMMNAQLMAVLERTREIGVLKAVGWSSLRVLGMILGESIAVGLSGGVLGVGIGWLMLWLLSTQTVFLGVLDTNLSSSLLIQAFSVVIILGLVGGIYPAWRAARMQPIEALRYEGGSGGNIRRLPFGGMAIQSLWQRSLRTFLTLGAVGITVGAIMALDGIVAGMMVAMNGIVDDVEVMVRQADIADTSLSTIDERIGDKIEALPSVNSATGVIFTAVGMPESGGFFIVFGYPPNSYAIQRFNVVEGEPLRSNHQILLGRAMADALSKGVGDTIELSGSRFRVAGIYESTVGFEEMGGIMTLRDAQVLIGRPRKVSMYMVKMNDPGQANGLVGRINQEFPEVHATLSGEFTEQMPDFQSSQALMDGISVLAILIGGVGVLNTMLMTVFERTREIGVLRSLGWRRRSILGLILREALLLGLLGGVVGVGIAFGTTALINLEPSIGSLIVPVWNVEAFIRALGVALILGIIGGLYPAYRATRLQPVEALRYE